MKTFLSGLVATTLAASQLIASNSSSERLGANNELCVVFLLAVLFDGALTSGLGLGESVCRLLCSRDPKDLPRFWC
jgi:hypothetical protein